MIRIGVRSFVAGGGVEPPLLDTYTGAAAAYSLRLLRTAYTGNAIRVRRSSDNTEQDIGFNLSGSLDTTALTTFVGANNAFVTTWYDQSGNGRNATQSTAANQPQIVSSGTVITKNTKPSIYFDGSNDLLGLNFTNTLQSIFVVGSKFTTNFAGYNGFVAYRVSPNSNLLPASNENGGFTGIPSTNNVNGLTATSIFINNISKNLTNYLDFNIGVALDYSTNYNLVSHYNTASTSGTKNIALGADVFTGTSRWLNGNIGEVILYPSNQSSNNSNINSNINTYYGIY